MTIKIWNGSEWKVVSGGGGGSGPSGTVYWSDIQGDNPLSNTNLARVMNTKLNANLGSTNKDKVLKVGSDGNVTTVETPTVSDDTLVFQ